MRVDDQKMKATQKSGAKDQQKHLEQQHQPQSPANRDRSERSHGEAGQGRVRSQDPNYGRGHH